MLKLYKFSQKENKSSIIAEVLLFCQDDGTIFLTQRSSIVNNPNVWDNS